MILAGDIGGTKTILAFLFSDKKQTLRLEKTYQSQAYPNLEAVIEDFMKGREESVSSACFAVAGPIVDGRCEATNLPWVVDAQRLKDAFGFNSVSLLNDLEATALGALYLEDQEIRVLNRGEADSRGNMAVIAAGTGLGEAGLFWDGSRYRPIASEGGHSDFAPRNPIEIQLLEYLLKKFRTVSYERVLSGPGLFDIHQFLKESGHGDEPAWVTERLKKEDPSAVIAEVGLSGKVSLCMKSMELFVSLYGAEAGNLALKFMATGGVYIGGGIAPKILDKLVDGTFLKAFTDKGRFASLMRRIPVKVILNPKTALRGAARVAFLQTSEAS